MAFGTNGLTALTEDELTTLLRHVHRGHLPCPITPHGLACVGCQHLSDKIDLLKGLDERGVRAVLIAVISERRQRG